MRIAVAVLAATGAILLAGPAPAQAHARLLRTSPANGASLTSAPDEVTLTFDEAALQVGLIVRVSGPAGVVSSGRPRIADATVHQSLSSDLTPGRYRVDWRATSDDGHPVSDTFAFTIAGAQPSPTPTATAPSPTSAGTPSLASAGTPTVGSSGASPALLLWGAGAIPVLLVAAAAVLLRLRRQRQGNP
jgi:methionine-rich copper-binding protein CopC